MSNSLAFYSDAGLTVPLIRLDAAQAVDGSAAAVDRVVWLGSTAAGTAFQADSDPGVDPVVVAIVDSATGLQIPASSLRLAASAGGLAGATPGSPLALAAGIESGVGNAVPVYVRIDAAAIAAGTYDNVSLATVPTIEVIL